MSKKAKKRVKVVQGNIKEKGKSKSCARKCQRKGKRKS